MVCLDAPQLIPTSHFSHENIFFQSFFMLMTVQPFALASSYKVWLNLPTWVFRRSCMRRRQFLGQSRLGDREGQRLAVAAAVATEVSGEIGRSMHDNLGSAGR